MVEHTQFVGKHFAGLALNRFKVNFCVIAAKYREAEAFLGPSGPNLYLLCVWQSDAAPFSKNYAKLCFDAKHLEKGLNIES